MYAMQVKQMLGTPFGARNNMKTSITKRLYKLILTIIFFTAIISFVINSFFLKYDTYTVLQILDTVIKVFNILFMVLYFMDIELPFRKVWRYYFYISLFCFFSYGFGRTIFIVYYLNLSFVLRILYYGLFFYFLYSNCFKENKCD